MHEFVLPPEFAIEKYAEGILLISRHEGERSRDPLLQQHDAQLLEAALQTERNPLLQSHYVYYLANCYRQMGRLEDALALYKFRTELGFIREEVTKSQMWSGRLEQFIKCPSGDSASHLSRLPPVEKSA